MGDISFINACAQMRWKGSSLCGLGFSRDVHVDFRNLEHLPCGLRPVLFLLAPTGCYCIRMLSLQGASCMVFIFYSVTARDVMSGDCSVAERAFGHLVAYTLIHTALECLGCSGHLA